VNIAFIITGLVVGGAETMLLKLLERLDRSKFRPMVISLTTEGDIGLRIASLGIPVVALGMRPSFPNPLLLLRLVGLIRRFKPDIVHTWMYHADLLGGLAAHIAGVKRIVWGIRHTDLSASANKRTTLAVVKVCAWLSAWLPCKILVNSEVSRAVHVTAGYNASKMKVIPNGFDVACFLPDQSARDSVRQELALAIDTPLVGVVGRYHPQKNQLGFVQVMSELTSKRPDVHFLLVGHGNDTDNAELMSAIRSAGLITHTHLLGQRMDVPRLMAALDLLALPSVGEAFPNVVGEAMACGVPCAVCDVGDAALIVGDTGRIVPAGDMPALAHAIGDLLRLAACERTMLGVQARERVTSMFEIRCVVSQFEAFYCDILTQ